MDGSRREDAGRRVAVLAAVLVFTSLMPASGQSLRGSHASLVRQHQWAKVHELTFLGTPADVQRFVKKGVLVPLRGNGDYEVDDGASFPYTRPEVGLFVTRVGAQYRRACGEKLVVTSLTRPISRQPRNASRLSAHPAGIAVDLRISRKASCRQWLERTLIGLERAGVLEATRERRPPHYHVAVFPEPYAQHAGGVTVTTEPEPAPEAVETLETAEAVKRTYRVRRGDSLWSIAVRNGLSVRDLRRANGMRSPRLRPGDRLLIPSAS